MAYTPTDWKDHVVQRPKTFEVKKNADGTLTLVPSPEMSFSRVRLCRPPISTMPSRAS